MLLCNKCGVKMDITTEGVNYYGDGKNPYVKLRCERCDITRFEKRKDIERDLQRDAGVSIENAIYEGYLFFPQYCFACLKTTTLRPITQLGIRLPICSDCYRQLDLSNFTRSDVGVKMRKSLLAPIFLYLIVFIIVLALMFILKYVLWGFFVLVFATIVVLFWATAISASAHRHFRTLQAQMLPEIEVTANRIQGINFKNEKYQRLFDEANGRTRTY